MAEIYRVLRPGGWVQLTETAPFSTIGPVNNQFKQDVFVLYDKLDLWYDIEPNLPSLLSNAGFEEIQIVKRQFPLGKGGGKVDEMARESYADVLRRLVPAFTKNGWEKEDIERRVQAVIDEWDVADAQAAVHMNTVVARKPAK
jgi:hypothetical protein